MDTPHRRPATRAQGWAWLALAVPLISLSAILPKLAAQPGASTGFWRFAIACALAIVLLRWMTGGRTAPGATGSAPTGSAHAAAGARPAARRSRGAAVVAGGAIGGDIVLWNEALLTVPAAEASLLGHTAPLWVGLLGWWLWGRRPHGAFWMACALIGAGLGLFVAHRLGDGAGDGVGLAGVAMCVAAGGLYGIYLLVAQIAREGMAAVPLMIVSQAVAAALCGGVALALGAPLAGFDAATWGWLLAGGVTGLAGSIALLQSMATLSAATVSIALVLQVPVAGAIAAWLFSERLVGLQALGAAVMAAGVLLIYARPAR